MTIPSLQQLGLDVQQPELPIKAPRPVFRDWDLESLEPDELALLGYLGPGHMTSFEAG
jgi:hypothetical protein